MRIFKYKNKIVEEVGRVRNNTVVFFKYLRNEDKVCCPNCSNPLDLEINIVEDSLQWNAEVREVDTVSFAKVNEK